MLKVIPDNAASKMQIFFLSQQMKQENFLKLYLHKYCIL